MARPRRPHLTQTRPPTAPVVVTRVSPALTRTALAIAGGDRSRITIVRRGLIEITDPVAVPEDAVRA